MSSVPRSKQRSTSPTITALIYTRVSTEDQRREGVSLDAQLADSRKYAARLGWVLGTEYQDILTGKRDDRPAYQQLLADVRTFRSQGTAIMVVVAALDRFGRRLLERVRSREELKALGVAVHSVREGGELPDLVANMLGAVAQEEVRWLGERVRVSRAYVRERGFMPAGKIPWGYLRRPATPEERAAGAPLTVLDTDEEVAPYVRELFQRVADGTSVRMATRWVRALPPHLLRGKVLAVSAVARLLRSPVYISRPFAAKGPDVLAAPLARWPALIDEAVWLRVQTYIDDHAIHRHQASQRYLLTGYLKCPKCGGLTTGNLRSHRPSRYSCMEEHARGLVHCTWAAPTRAIDTAVLELVSRVLAPFAAGDHQFEAAIARSWRTLQQPDDVGAQREKRVTHLKRQAAKARDRLANAATLLVDGGIDREGYELVRDRSHAELIAVEDELARLGAVDRGPVLPPLPEVLAQIGAWESLLKQADTALQREVLAVLVQRVDPVRVAFGRYGVHVTWTPTGAALAELAGVGDTEPPDLKVIPFVPYTETMVPCEVCGTEFRGNSRQQTCREECKLELRRRRWAAKQAAKKG
jgi:site-specific DNA recombinase